MALRSAGLQMSTGYRSASPPVGSSAGARRYEQHQQEQQQHHQQQHQHQHQQPAASQHHLSLGRNASDAMGYGDVDSAAYGSRGDALDEYVPNYDVPGESPWDKLMDAAGCVFYSNRVTGEVRWDRPADFDDSLDTALAGAPGAPSAEELRDQEVPFLKDMVRNCPTKAFLRQFLEGPENYLRHLNENHGPKGTNIFHHACTYNPRVDVVDYLVEAKAEINKFTDAGLTPVDLCKNAGRVDVCKYLLARGGMTRLVFDAHEKRARDRRENLKRLHQSLPAAMRALMKLMQTDFEGVRIQIVEVDKYVEVRWAVDAEHEEVAAIQSYMDSLSEEEPHLVELRLAPSEPWAQFTEDEKAGSLLVYRFEPPWLSGYDADTERIHKGKQVGPPPGGPPPAF